MWTARLAALPTYYPDGSVIIKAVNRLDQAQTVEISLEGDFAASGQGRAEVLTANDPSDENSSAEPKKVAPVLRELDGFGSSFSYTFDAYSVTVIRIKHQY
jgi:alpha-N-arabinofuranosidase